MLDVPERELQDLRDRLARTRWPDPETVQDWSQGVPLAYVQGLCAYWAHGYDWRTVEARLNAIGQYRTNLDGLDIHFLHARSPHPDAVALLLTHGWPGSVVEFLKVIDPLVDPRAMVAGRLTRFTSSARRCRATASVRGRRPRAGERGASPARGRS
jgi:hypothetical protein